MTPCRVEHCDTKVRGDSRCVEHGGHPNYEEHEDIYGEPFYRFYPERPHSEEQASAARERPE